MTGLDCGTDRAGRRAKRLLSPSQKYQIWLQLVRREVTIAEAAAEHRVDRSTIMGIGTLAEDGALAALAAAKPGVQARERDYELELARAEVKRLSETVTEMAVRLMLVEGKGRREVLDPLAWDVSEHLTDYQAALDRVARATRQANMCWEQLFGDDELLRSLPGIGPATGPTMRAFVGDGTVFDTCKQAACYAGIVELVVRHGRSAVAADHEGRPGRAAAGLLSGPLGQLPAGQPVLDFPGDRVRLGRRPIPASSGSDTAAGAAAGSRARERVRRPGQVETARLAAAGHTASITIREWVAACRAAPAARRMTTGRRGRATL
jgi:transposase-like protein